MAFRYDSNMDNKFQTMTFAMQMAVTNGTHLHEGNLVKIVAGRVSLAATDGVIGGIARISDSAGVTGDVNGTVKVDVQFLRAGDILVVEQGAVVADADCQPGDYVDITATADGITKTYHDDLICIKQDTTRNLVWVMVTNRQFP